MKFDNLGIKSLKWFVFGVWALKFVSLSTVLVIEYLFPLVYSFLSLSLIELELSILLSKDVLSLLSKLLLKYLFPSVNEWKLLFDHIFLLFSIEFFFVLSLWEL